MTTSEMHDAACAYVEEQFARYGQCFPTWLLNVAGRVIWIETIWRTDEEKYAYVDRMAFMLQGLSGHAYTTISEAWVAVSKPDKDGKFTDKRMPSERPKNERDDIAMIVTQPRMGKSLHSRYLVTIRDHGLNFLGPRIDEDHYRVTGNMMTLFDTRFEENPRDFMMGMIRKMQES